VCPGNQNDQLCIKHSIASGLSEVTVPPCIELVQPHLKHSVPFWEPQYRKDIELLKCVQRRATRTVKGHKGKTYKKQLRPLGLFSLEKRRLRHDLITAYTFLKVGSRGGSADLLSLVTSGRTRGNGVKQHQGKFRLDIRIRFFTERVVGHYNTPGKWSRHQACQSSRSIWTTLLVLWFSFRQSQKEKGFGHDDPYWSLPT